MQILLWIFNKSKYCGALKNRIHLIMSHNHQVLVSNCLALTINVERERFISDDYRKAYYSFNIWKLKRRRCLNSLPLFFALINTAFSTQTHILKTINHVEKRFVVTAFDLNYRPRLNIRIMIVSKNIENLI